MSTAITAQHEATSTDKQPRGFFSLPAEVRVAIYDLAEPADPVLPRAGPLFPGLDGLVRANKQARSEILQRKLKHVTWRGRTTSKTWRRFKTTLIPHIRHLTMEVKQGCYRGMAFEPEQLRTWLALEIACVSEVRDLLTWVFWRNKDFLKGKCAWRLDRLTLVAIYKDLIDGFFWPFEDHDERDPAHRAARRGISHWSKIRQVKRLRDSGISVEMGSKRVCRGEDDSHSGQLLP